jgi:hypothetical protein
MRGPLFAGFPDDTTLVGSRDAQSRSESASGEVSTGHRPCVCASGLSSLDLFRQIAPHVRAAVPYACSGWLGTDPATLLCTSCYVENIRHEDCTRLKDNELFTRDFAKFDHLARSGRNAVSLLAETHGQLDLPLDTRSTPSAIT